MKEKIQDSIVEIVIALGLVGAVAAITAIVTGVKKLITKLKERRDNKWGTIPHDRDD